MPINDSTCSESQNSTDCLLKALLDAVDQQSKAEDAEFNWDPLSFGAFWTVLQAPETYLEWFMLTPRVAQFTAPVGILAALFTLMTVIQMIITSGPGRRRSDKQVIGRWSSRKRTHLSWSELRLLTVVPTPVLKIISLRQILHASLDALEESDQVEAITVAPTTDRCTRRLSNLHQATKEYSTVRSENKGASAILARFKWWKRPDQNLPIANATQSSRAKWLVHLDELDLEGLVFEKGDFDHNAADYLPDDLQAVPAYSEVGCTVALAAASGISSLKADQQSPYPLVIGKGFQLNFREHPLLGSIGAFSRHGRRDVGQSRPSKEEVLLALYHAEGEVEANAKGFVSSRQLYVSGHPFRPHCRCGGNPGDFICSSAALLYEKHKNVSWLLAAETPRRVPSIFPSRSVKLRNVLTTFILQNQSWAHTRGSRLQDDIRTIFPSEYGPMRVWWTDDTVTELPSGEEMGEGLSYFLATDTERRAPTPHHPEYSFLLQPKFCGAISEVFQLCFRFLYDSEDFEEWWHTLSERQVEMNRIAILIQIQQLDKLLAVTDPSLLECRKTIIYLTAQAFLIVEEDVASQTLNTDRLMQLGATSEGASTFWDSPRMRFFRHFEPTLKTLDTLLAPYEDSKAVGFDSEFARQKSRLKTIISPWYSPDSASRCQARDALLQRLKDSVDGYKKAQEGIDGHKEMNRAPRTAKIEEVVDDIIIWRIVLLGLLFLTVPDNSTILDSGLWKHVIPLL